MSDQKTLDLSLISPKGNRVTIAVTGSPEEQEFLQELLLNSEEFTEWLRTGEVGGADIGRYIH